MSESKPLMGSKYQETGTTFFFITILISAIGAATFGWTLGYTSPIMVSNDKVADKYSPGLLCPYYKQNDHTKKLELAFVNGTFVHSKVPHSNVTYAQLYNMTETAFEKKIKDNHDKMNCDLHMTQDFQYWFGSIVNMGCLIGALGGGSLADAIGKKKTMVLMHVIFLAGWLMIWQTPKPTNANWTLVGATPEVASNAGATEAMLMAGRILTGMAVGISCTTIAAYQMEICPTAIRGGVGTIFQIFIVFGLFASYLIGSSVPWDTLAFIPTAMSAIGLVTTFMLVESPVWLLSKGRDAEAKAALRQFRAGASSEDLDLMLNDMRTTDDDGDASGGGMSELFGDPTNRKALGIGIGLMLVQQLSGINAIMFYSGTILQTVASSAAQANTYATGMQGLQVVVTFSSAFFMDRAGRVPILLFAACGMVVSTYALAYYYIFTTGGPKMLALVAFYGYVFFFGCGMGAIPWSIMGEIFQPSIKGLASSFATGVNWTCSFVITYTVAKMTDGFQGMFKSSHPEWADTHPHAGMGVVFFVYGSVALLGIVFVKAFIPETKGKTMAQIQAELRGEKSASAYSTIQ